MSPQPTSRPRFWLLAFGASMRARVVHAALFGIAYGLAFWRTGTLWAALGLHWGWNFAGQAVDAVWQIEVHAQAGVKLLSAAAHLGMALVVLGGEAGRCHA